jgi:membrane associated rhomboid family serine protease
MTPTSVGMRCPECARNKTRVVRRAYAGGEPIVTYALIGANVLAYFGTVASGASVGGSLGGDSLLGKAALNGPAVANGDWWRIITAGFMHYGLLHLAFNMYALYLLGSSLERYVGSLRFGLIYLLSALSGSFGALLLSPNSLTAGASGAIFGLMGAMLVLERHRGVQLLGGSIGGLLVVNLIFTFAYAGSISVGGHIGGLIGGVLTGVVLSGYGRGHLAHGRLTPSVALGLMLIATGTIAGSLAVAGG